MSAFAIFVLVLTVIYVIYYSAIIMQDSILMVIPLKNRKNHRPSLGLKMMTMQTSTRKRLRRNIPVSRKNASVCRIPWKTWMLTAQVKLRLMSW